MFEHVLGFAQLGEIPFFGHWYDAGWVGLFIDCAGLTTSIIARATFRPTSA